MPILRAVEAAGHDLRHGLRSIRRNPNYSAMLILILAVCLGTNIAVFSVVYSVLLRPLPFPNADEIVLMANRYPKVGAGETGFSSPGDYYDRMRGVSAVQDQAMFHSTWRILETVSSAERVMGIAATPSLFRLLRAAPQFGRAFEESEGEIGNESKVILSDAFWRSQYAGDRAILGRSIRLSGNSFTVVGVMPPDFRFHDPAARFWIPLAFTPEQKGGHHSNGWLNVGRLRPGATVLQAQSQVDAINAANLETAGALRETLIAAGFETKVVPLKEYLVRDIGGSLQLLWAGAALVLLIGALNAAGLVLARTNARNKEMGTRLALGAGWSRLACALIAENVLLAAIGGLLGLGLAAVMVELLATLGLGRFPRASEVSLDGTVVLFGLCASVTAGLTIALFSTGHLSRLKVSGALGDLSRLSTAGRRSGLVRKVLVVAQVSLTFVLLAGSALLLASFRELLRVQSGYRIEGILTATTSASAPHYRDSARFHTLMARSLDAIRRLPGVVSAGAASAIPLKETFADIVIFSEGHSVKAAETVVAPIQVKATPGYLDAMGIRLLSGRDFDDRDTEKSMPVVIVDEGLAERFWPGKDPVGRRMFQPSGADGTRWLTVIGVVVSTRLKNLAGTDNAAGAYYFPYSQTAERNFTLAIKTSVEPSSLAPALRKAFAEVDPSLALFDVSTMAERAASSLASRRAALTLSLTFGTISLFLASIGLYAVLAYLLTLRRREIGIRIAVGCAPAQVFWLFLRQGAVLTGIGILLGLLAAVLGRQAIEKFLYGVRPLDPGVLGLVALALGFIAFLAVAAPARQAARVDPIAALNDQ